MVISGRDKYLKLGASAVLLGTAFLATDESRAAPVYKARLLSKDSFHTQLESGLYERANIKMEKHL